MIDDTVALMMMISAFISVIMLVLVIAFSKKSYFEDYKKSFEYPLFDSVDDLREAKDREDREKEISKTQKK